MQHIRPLHLQCVIACLFLFFCSSRAALSDYSPFYMNATWTTGIPSSTTVVDSVFDNSSNVVYILDSQFKVYKLNYYTLSTSITRDWSSVVTSGMMPWSHERKTKNSVLGVNPYSSEVFLATYCYASSGRSTLIIYRFNGNLYQIGNSVQYTYSSSNFFTKQYRNPRLKLHFVSRDILHVAAFHDNSVYNGLWLSSIRISYNFGGDEEEDNNLTTKLATCLACLQITAVAIDFGCNGASVCIWTNSRAVSEYRLTDYSFKNQTTIDTLSTPIQFDPAAHRFGDVIFFVHRLVNDSSKLIAHSKTTTHNSVDTDVLPYRYDFPAQIDIDIRVSLGGSVFVGFTSNITSSNLNSYDIVISQYNSSLRRLSTTVMTTVRQDNLTLVIPRNNNMSFSVVGSSDGSLDNPNATQASRTIFVAHFKAFSISNVQPSIVSPGKSIEIEFSALPSGATTGIPRVIFNGRMCTNSRWNSNLLNTTVGPGVGGPHELSVIFDYLPFRPSVATDTMLSFPPAAILNIIPSEVPAAGYPITIIVNPIGYTTESLAVEVGGRPCANAVQISENSLQCTVGPGTGRNHSVVVIIGTNRSNGSAFISYHRPILSQIVPSAGPVAGNNQVNLTGSNFGTCSSGVPCSPAPNSWVNIGGKNCTSIKLFSDTRLTCVAPSGVGRNHTVCLSINGQESNEISYAYERPLISVLVPRSSVESSPTVYIEGFNFGFNESHVSVNFTDVNTSAAYPCPTVTLSSDSHLRCDFGNSTIPLFAEFDVTITVFEQKSLLSSNSKFYSGISNSPPVAYQFNTSVHEDQSTIIQLEGSDPDAGDAVRIYVVTTPQHGNLYYYLATSIDPKGPIVDASLWPVELPLGRVIYFPPFDFHGEDSFSFIVRDNYNAESSLSYANISILPVSDPPVPNPLHINISEDSVVLVNFTFSDPDSHTSVISIIIITLPSAGFIFELDDTQTPITEITSVPFELSNYSKTVMYRPPLNSVGIVSGLSFKVRDETADSLIAAEVTISIDPVNDAPVASNKSYSISEDSAVTITFDCGDVDFGDKLSVYVDSVPPLEAGNLFFPELRYKLRVYPNDPVPASLTFELASNFYGDFSFGYRCRDGSLFSERAYINVEVTDVNDAPTALSETFTVDEETDLSIQLVVSDVETNDQISITILALPHQGNLLAQMNDTDALNNTWSVITPDTIPWTMPFYRKNLIFRPFPDTHGDPYAIFSFQCDDGIDKSIIATIAIKVTSVNDHPTMNFTSLDILAYEDSEVTITLDIKDVDLNDRLLVKITDIIVNGTLYHFDRRTNSRTQLTIGEGSEIAGPPYVIVFRPTPDFYSETVDSIQKFNVTFTDLSGAGSSHQVNFSVLPVNDRPIIDCVSNSIELPLDFVITSFGEYNFTIEVTDVDNAQVNFVLVKAPQQGYLSAEGIAFAENSQFTTKQLSFHSNNSGGGYPYSYFSVYAVDDAGAVSNTCTFQFTFTCPPRLYNNIFSGGKGPTCSECPTGSFCSQDGKHRPHPNFGWWKNNDSNAYVPCIPLEACPGSESECSVGYEGQRCGKCSSGFYRISGTCKSCKTALPDWVVPVGTVGVFTLICVMSLALKGGPSEGLMNIILNFIQTVALFDQLNFDFYPALEGLVEGFHSIGYLNIEVGAPECILSKYQFVGALDYRFKFTVITLLPLILLGIVSAVVILNTYPFLSLFVRIRKCVDRQNSVPPEVLYDHQNRTLVSCIQAYNTLLGMIYIIVVNQSLAIFDCSLEPDGQYWMDAQPDSLCYQGWWESYATLAYVAIACYVIGIPLYFAVLIFFYYQTRFFGTHWLQAREYAERMLNVQKSYFRMTHQYFIVIQFIRKILVVIVKMFFSKYLVLQAVLTSVILSIDAVLSAKYLPYVFKSLNALEVICTLSAIVIMNGALLIHLNQFRTVSQRDVVAAIIIILLISCVTVAILMVIIEVIARIKKWKEINQKSQVFDEKFLANTQIGGSISRFKLVNMALLRTVFEQTLDEAEESMAKLKQKNRHA